MRFIKAHGRFVVAFVALAIAFGLSVRFSDRGVQFDLRNTSVSASETKDGEYDLTSLKILNRVLLQIKDNYVEPDRIDANKMLVYALDEIQNSIAEVVVEFDKPRDEKPTKATLTVNGERRSYTVGNIESLWEMSFRLKEMFRFVQEHLDPETDVEYREVEYAAINGMLHTLDPHSTLLPPEHYEEMQTQTGGKFGGLGIVISIRDGDLTVISPIDGTPASRAGIRARDHIVRIGEESTVNMGLSEAVNMLRGEPGSAVELWIQRKGWSEARRFSVERAIIKIDSVDSEPLSNKIGYMRIKNFQANTYSDMKEHLSSLKQKMGGMQGLVLDLRDNPGGLLDQAIKVSDLFLEEGTIVSTVGVGNRLREKREAKRGDTEGKYPIVVLVNAGSASASEIVSGALQNHNRAVVLGDTTFGKGSVQVLYEFPDNSALKLTVAQYLTPGGISIQSKGITPDLRAVPITIDDDDVDLFLSERIVREQDLDAHLTSTAVRDEEGGPGQYVRYLNEVPDEEEDEFRDPDEFREDFEILLAQRLLKRAGKEFSRPKLLTLFEPEVESSGKDELAKITRELKKLGVDWAPGPSRDSANLDVQVSTTPEASKLKAGEEFKVNVKVTNKGTDELYQLKAISESDHAVLDDREFPIGRLAPGQTREWSLDVTVPKDAPTRHDVVLFHFSDARTKFPDEKLLAVNVTGADRPQFGFSYEVKDSSGDGVLSVGESVKLNVIVKNVGKADSAETLIHLKNLERESLYLTKGRARLDALPAGESTTVDFEFDVKHPPQEGDEITLEVDIYDTTYREFTEKEFDVPFSKADQKVADANGTAKINASDVNVFAGADDRADIAAVVSKGGTLPVTGRAGDWLRVDLGLRTGWVKESQVAFDGSDSSVAGLTRDVMFQPPSVQIRPADFITSNGNVAVKGAAQDDSGLKDYYIFVYNRENAKLNAKKLEYVRAKGDSIDIATNVPLFKGMNRIAIVARDQEGMTTTESTYVYRK